MDFVPVVNCFNGNMTVKHREAVSLLLRGKCRIAYQNGEQIGLEWVFDAPASNADCSRSVRHGGSFETVPSWFEDAEPGMPVMQFWTRQETSVIRHEPNVPA